MESLPTERMHGAAEDAPAGPAGSAHEERTRLLTAISHDLRQPIHAIGLLVAAIKEHPHAPATARLIERLDRSLHGLDELFGRLLEFGRLGTGSVAPQARTFEVEPALRTLQERFAQAADQRGLQLRCRVWPGLTVHSDAALVAEILMNLLSNALRCTKQGGVLLTARRQGGQVALQVWDTGVGIEPAQCGRIFDEFVQLGAQPHGRRQGLGLGLAIVRRLAQALGSSVQVRSRPGRGSVFTLVLPAGSAAPSQSTDDGRPDALAGLLVLVVDDDPDTLAATEAALAAWGCFVLTARDQASALAAVERSERFPDVLITEYWLGGKPGGPAVAGAVRSAQPHRLPVLVTTADTSQVVGRAVQLVGATLLSKPACPDRLRAALAVALAEQR